MSGNGYPSFAECVAIFNAVPKWSDGTWTAPRKAPNIKTIAKIKRILAKYWVSARFARRTKMEREI